MDNNRKSIPINIPCNAERSLGEISVVFADLHTRIIHSHTFRQIRPLRRILNFYRQDIVEGLAGGPLLFKSYRGCIGQIVGHGVQSVLFVDHGCVSSI